MKHHAQEGTIGWRIRELRRSHCLTQYELAQRSGIRAHSLWRIEMGLSKSPKIDVIAALARVLGTTVDELTAPAASVM